MGEVLGRDDLVFKFLVVGLVGYKEPVPTDEKEREDFNHGGTG
jgi:hypothetical protein